jgi:hypothetical protein
MNINPLLQYRVVEFLNGVVIVPSEAIVNMPQCSNLIIADMRTCCEYLARYTEHRANGKEVKEAHELALRGANVITNVRPS